MEAILLLGSLGFMLMNAVKSARARQWDPVITTIAVWLIGFLLVVIASHSTLLETRSVPGLDPSVTFGSLDWWSQLLLGASILSVLGVTDKIIKAIDNSQSAATPTLLPGSPPPHA